MSRLLVMRVWLAESLLGDQAASLKTIRTLSSMWKVHDPMKRAKYGEGDVAT